MDTVSIRYLVFALAAVVVQGVTSSNQPPPGPSTMDEAAQGYVRLVLAMGHHDKDYVDAYYGPAAWKAEVEAEKPSVGDIAARARRLIDWLAKAPPAKGDEMVALRHRSLKRQLEALEARTRMLSGEKLRFDEESKALYDAVAPTHPPEHFEKILADLEKKLPGTDSLLARYEAFRKAFVIPRDRLDRVFRQAINGCRSRTLQHMDLPNGETFTIEYVTGKSWSGYNWYQGGFKSLIQVNTDLPIYVDRAIDLACHEGYPGHHVFNALIEQHLVKKRGWIEFSVYPLFSPLSLIFEGTANVGIEVAFPGPERVQYEREVIFPLAGVDPNKADEYYGVQALVDRLSYAGNEAARRYLNGEIDARAASDWLEKYALYSRDRAAQRVRFIDQYRSYVINYNVGKDLVRAYIESRGGTASRPDRRWDEFEKLLSAPRLPSELQSRR